MTDFEKGRRVWDRQGREYLYFAEVDGVHLASRVEDLPEVEAGWEYLNSLDEVYDRPPVHIYHDSIKRLKEEIAILTQKKSDLLKSVRDLDSELQKQRNKADKWPKLALAFDVLEDKITHAVVKPEFRIVDFQDYIKNPEFSKPKDTKMLCLLGNPDKQEWALNRYSDGSGGYEGVELCHSYEEALQVVEGVFEEALNKWREGAGDFWFIRSLVAGRPIAEIPEDVLTELKKQNLERKREAIEAAQVALKKAESMPEE